MHHCKPDNDDPRLTEIELKPDPVGVALLVAAGTLALVLAVWVVWRWL